MVPMLPITPTHLAAAGAPLEIRCGERVLVPRCRVARGFFGRALGLMGRRGLPPGEGLLLAPCGEIHTCFMRFPLDAIFLDREGAVVRVVRGLRPWRLTAGGRGARTVIEAQSGWLDAEGLGPGERLTARPCP